MDLASIIFLEGVCYMGKILASLTPSEEDYRIENELKRLERRRIFWCKTSQDFDNNWTRQQELYREKRDNNRIEGILLALPTPLEFLYLAYQAGKGYLSRQSKGKSS